MSTIWDPRTYDSERRSETSSLISQASSKANSWGIPVVYSGDFNSEDWYGALFGLAYTGTGNLRDLTNLLLSVDVSTSGTLASVTGLSVLGTSHSATT